MVCILFFSGDCEELIEKIVEFLKYLNVRADFGEKKFVCNFIRRANRLGNDEIDYWLKLLVRCLQDCHGLQSMPNQMQFAHCLSMSMRA